ENDWQTGEDLRCLAVLAALFHDFGKANAGFQKKLRSRKPIADPYRHEWVSLRLFRAFVGADGDAQWLQRLASLQAAPDGPTACLDRLVSDGVSPEAPSPFQNMPPLAQAIGWLIVSHHRLPTQAYGNPKAHVEELRRLPLGIRADWNGARADAADADRQACWSFSNGTPFDSRPWRERVSSLARRMLARSSLVQANWLGDPYVIHVSRLVLMLADHYFSAEPGRPSAEDSGCRLHANTDRGTGALNQRLDEHLTGVATHSSRIARVLPRLEDALPRIARHKGFKRRSSDSRFRWQDTAYDLATGLQTRSAEHGFFGINMASTGCGKTLANGRILYGLADSRRGARFSIALGLRQLTLQTGEAYRQRLGLRSEDLAILVGGGGIKDLFQREASRTAHPTATGSESAEPLLEDNSYVHFEGNLDESPLAKWLKRSPDAQRLVSAPVLVCTIDHLTPATEGVRGGRQIAPMLRLLTSDLVLDEPDDFDLEDLPALCRLVHWAGLLGSRVLLSSATLPPPLVRGLFAAYLEGRRSFQKNRRMPGTPLAIPCAWFDEYGAVSGDYESEDLFAQAHGAFVERRVQKLGQGEVRRRARIEPLPAPTLKPQDARAMLAGKLSNAGFYNVYVYRDGFPDWQRRGNPVKQGENP
ncbi:MAG: type I-F CRISPR-associated helicase Cas3f, partial [Pseudomonadota bacterium]